MDRIQIAGELTSLARQVAGASSERIGRHKKQGRSRSSAVGPSEARDIIEPLVGALRDGIENVQWWLKEDSQEPDWKPSYGNVYTNLIKALQNVVRQAEDFYEG